MNNQHSQPPADGLSDQRARLLMSMLRKKNAASAEAGSGSAGQSVSGRLQPVPRTDGMAASFAQERLWFLDRMGAGNATASAYTVPGMVRLQGQLDSDALERAMLALIARHESLRTRFVNGAEGLQQAFDSAPTQLLEHFDCSGFPADSAQAALEAQVQAMLQRPFDLTRGHLLRALLVRESAHRHRLLIVMHHIIADGWSMGVLVRELGAFYTAALAAGGVPDSAAANLPPMALQYADYAQWQRQSLQGEELARELAYWRANLQAATNLELPCDRPRPATPSFKGAQVALELDAGLMQALQQFARDEGVTLFMLLLAGFSAVLARWSGQTDVVVGTPVAGRVRPELEGLIGLFVNSLALRTSLAGDPDFRTLLLRVRDATVGAYAHAAIPFERVVQELQPGRDASRQPLFQTRLVLQNLPPLDLALTGLQLQEQPLNTGTSKYDLSLYLQATENGMTGTIEYATDLFDAATMQRLGQWYLQFLRQALAAPQLALSRLSLLDADGIDCLLNQFSGRQVALPSNGHTLHGLIEAQVARCPQAIALQCGSESLSYARLDERANALARYLLQLGVQPEQPVGLLLERSLPLVVAMLACLKAGAAYLPLDPTYPPERLALMLQDAEAPLVISVQALAHIALPGSARLVVLERDAAAIEACGSPPLAQAVAPDALAYVLYTSGSTGVPKGVMVSHRALANYLAWAGGLVSERKVSGSVVHSPLGFDLTVTSFYPPLVTGGKVTLLPAGERMDEVGALAATIGSRQPLGIIKLTPSHLSSIRALLDERLEQAFINTVVVGGEAMSASLIRPWLAALPDTAFVNHYGPTETTVGCCTYRLPRTVRANTVVPIGKPIAGMQLYVLDAHLQLVPPGVAGELYIGGAGLARGYRARPDLTAERFVPDPFGSGARLYRSGDLARWRGDGNLEYLGRIDQQVKLRGFRIELGEVEAALARQSGVQQAACAIKGEDEERRLIGYVVLAEGTSLDPASLRGKLQQLLPDYMVPTSVMVLSALPLTPNGKLDRNALPQDDGKRVLVNDWVAPQPGVETQLAALWAQVLKVERVGSNDSFFDLGGHSLLATTLVSRIRQSFGVDIALRSVFEAPTLANVAAQIQAAAPLAQNAMPAITRIARTARTT